MTFANNLDPDDAPQNVGLHLRSKLFDIQIIYRRKKWVETMNFLKILKETNIWKNYPACKELRVTLCSLSVKSGKAQCSDQGRLWLRALDKRKFNLHWHFVCHFFTIYYVCLLKVVKYRKFRNQNTHLIGNNPKLVLVYLFHYTKHRWKHLKCGTLENIMKNRTLIFLYCKGANLSLSEV